MFGMHVFGARRLRGAFAMAAATLALLGPGGAAEAAAGVRVEAVQAPAWVERNDQRQPLVAGQELRNRDRIVTGGEARVLLRLPEGSAVKLGENANVRVDAIGMRGNRVFTAALDIAQGAFRFTTGVFGKSRLQRAVNVRAGTVTAGIRGTDLWGRSNDERDLVCLIEGRITVTHEQAEPVALSEPLSFYAAPKGWAPEPVAKVDPAQLAQWALETELQPAAATFRRDGRWAVQLTVEPTEAAALARYDQLRAAGYPVRIRPQTTADGNYAYALRVFGITTRRGAEALAAALPAQIGVDPMQVSVKRGR